MTKILFICHGNICRSPMAEFIFKDMVKKAGRESEFYAESAATSAEELGNPVSPSARDILEEHGIDCSGKRARRLTKADYDKFDLLIGMDSANIRNINRMCGGDPQGKIKKLLSYTGTDDDVADPWYTDNYEIAWADIYAGVTALVKTLGIKP